MFAIMLTLHLKDSGDLHVLELASIPNKCMQCCLFLKETRFEMCLLRGVPPVPLSHAQKITSQPYVRLLSLFSLNENQQNRN